MRRRFDGDHCSQAHSHRPLEATRRPPLEAITCHRLADILIEQLADRITDLLHRLGLNSGRFSSQENARVLRRAPGAGPQFSRAPISGHGSVCVTGSSATCRRILSASTVVVDVTVAVDVAPGVIGAGDVVADTTGSASIAV